jgi:hypothetical protein
LIHTKSGKTFTSKTHYPWDVPEENITSVERVIDGKSIAIKKHPALHHFFVKSTESRDFVMVGARPGSRPPTVEARAVGCHIGKPPNVYRLELGCDPRTGNVILSARKVTEATRDGFDPRKKKG